MSAKPCVSPLACRRWPAAKSELLTARRVVGQAVISRDARCSQLPRSSVWLVCQIRRPCIVLCSLVKVTAAKVEDKSKLQVQQRANALFIRLSERCPT